MTSGDPRSLDLCAIGLGQGGGNLAAEWRRRGYRALLLNTASTDLRALEHHEGLDVPSELVVDIALEGTEGAGKDPDYGAACVRAHADEIRAAVETKLHGADGLLVCAGLGGGTGSAVPELLKVLESLELPTISVATLPSDSESGIAKVNAVKAANALVGRDLAGRMFIDNDRLVGSHGELDLISWFPAVNARVLAPLDELNRLNRREELWSIRTFDGEDLRKVLLSGGVLQTHVARLEAEHGIDARYLVDVVAACVDGGNHLARGLDLSQVAYLALVVTGPEAVLRATAMSVFDDAVRELKERSGGGAVYEGLYVSPDDQPLRAYVLSASLALPSRITDLLGEARAEGSELARKIQEHIPGLEVSPLEGLELFRTPTRRPEGARPPAPEPRPLAAQLKGEVDSLEELSRPQEVDLPSAEDSALGEVSDFDEESVKPRVGTGRYDDEEAAQMEPTHVAHADQLAEVKAAGKKKKKRKKKAAKKPAKDATPRVGSGRWDPELVERADEPTMHVDESDARDPLRRETVSYDKSNLPSDIRRQVEEPIRPQTDRAALLPADAPVDYDLDDDADSFELEGNMTSPDATPAHHGAIADDESDESTATFADKGEDLSGLDSDVLLSSLLEGEPEGTELQSVYEDLIERYRQAADGRGRDRVSRRLMDDARADDVEVRALAVWAMVKLEDPGFKRTLKKCAADGNREIARLARSGLDRMGG